MDMIGCYNDYSSMGSFDWLADCISHILRLYCAFALHRTPGTHGINCARHRPLHITPSSTRSRCITRWADYRYDRVGTYYRPLSTGIYVTLLYYSNPITFWPLAITRLNSFRRGWCFSDQLLSGTG